MRNVNLDLCDLDHLYEDVSLATPAKIIAENGQDYNILLNEPVTTVSASLNMNSQCISDIGKLNVICPADKADRDVSPFSHVFTVNTHIQSAIDEIICLPKATININGPNNYKTFNLGKVESSEPININMSSADAGTTNIGEIAFEEFTLSSTLGTINNTKPAGDTTTATFNSCRIDESTINASGININNHSLFNNCQIIANITGTPGSPSVASPAGDVPTIKISSSIVKNSIISGYNVTYTSPGTNVFGVNPEPFDAAIQFKQNVNLQNFYRVEGAFKGDYDYRVKHYDQTAATTAGVSIQTNKVNIYGFNSVLATFNNVSKIVFSDTRLRPSGQIIPAMPNAIPPQEERIVPSYLSGAPYISTNIETVAKPMTSFTTHSIGTSITIVGQQHPNENYESIGYVHVNSSLTADTIHVQYVSNLGTMTCDYLSILGAGGADFEDGQGAGSFLNYGTLNYNRKLGTIVNMPGGIVNGDSTEGEIV